MQHFPSFGASFAFPFTRLTCMLSAFAGPSSIVRGTGHPYPPLCTLWEAALWFGLWLCSNLRCCFSWCLYPMILRHFYPFVADRRATARTTETLSHAAISQKKAERIRYRILSARYGQTLSVALFSARFASLCFAFARGAPFARGLA